MLPALIVAYLNPDGTKRRIAELKQLGFKEIYVFLDGFTPIPRMDLLQKRLELENYLNSSRDNETISELFKSTSNLGLGVAVPTALDWFFTHTEIGLVLEDDCQVLDTMAQILEAVQFNPIQNSLVCLSNPRPSDNSRVLEFSLSPFFSSWGWISTGEVWRLNRVGKLSLLDIAKAVTAIREISVKRRALLFVSWFDVWWGLRKNQNRLWAFRFTINLIIHNTNVWYPNVKVTQHHPTGFGINVQSSPTWDIQSRFINSNLDGGNTFKVSSDLTLNDYIAINVHGASIRSLLIRFTYRISRRIGVK
jgi:hypothetical protein